MEALGRVAAVSLAILGITASSAWAGDGTFTETGTPIPTASAPGRLVVGDFNRDGDEDIATMGNRTVTIFSGTAGAGFDRTRVVTFDSTDLADLALGDVNLDGLEDLVMTGNDDSATNGTVTIMAGQSNGTFIFPTRPTGSSFSAVAVGNLNDNFSDEIVAGHLELGNGSFTVFKDSSQTPQAARATNDSGPLAMVIADFDGDGANDLAMSSFTLASTAQFSVFKGLGEGSFATLPVRTFSAAPNGVTSIGVADFDGDGDEDMALPSDLLDNVTILRNDGGFNFTLMPPFSAGTDSAPAGVAVGDFNSDGDPDLALSLRANENFSTDTGAPAVEVFLGGQGLGFGPGAVIPILGNGLATDIAVGDFNRDEVQDLAVVDDSGGTLHILTGNGAAWSSGNLLQQGGVEGLPLQRYDDPENDLPAPWTAVRMRTQRYDSYRAPARDRAQGWEGGESFISGNETNLDSSASQTVDVSSAAGAIDAGQASVTLSAMLGGWTTRLDAMSATATFADAAGTALGSFTIGPVTYLQRNGRTVLLPRSQTATVPASTRSITVTLAGTQPASGTGANDGANTAAADNVKLTMQLPSDSAPPPGGGGGGAGSTDTTPPKTKIRKGPEKKTDAENARITFEADEPATFECKLKGDAKRLRDFEPCDDGKVKYKNLDEGKKHFQVRATDAAGNVDETPAKLEWKVTD